MQLWVQLIIKGASMKTTSTYALLAGMAAVAVAGTMFHNVLASTEKTLQCEATTHPVYPYDPATKTQLPPHTGTMNVVIRLTGDQWRVLTSDGRDFTNRSDTLPMRVTDQMYILRDTPSDYQPEGLRGTNNLLRDSLSIDRITGEMRGNTTLKDTTWITATGHCTPVSGPTL
jgi:hypothetical protein